MLDKASELSVIIVMVTHLCELRYILNRLCCGSLSYNYLVLPAPHTTIPLPTTMAITLPTTITTTPPTTMATTLPIMSTTSHTIMPTTPPTATPTILPTTMATTPPATIPTTPLSIGNHVSYKLWHQNPFFPYCRGYCRWYGGSGADNSHNYISHYHHHSCVSDETECYGEGQDRTSQAVRTVSSG